MAAKEPVLIMLQGPEPGSRYRLLENRVVTIGRSSQNQISLVNPSVSRFHCEIAYVNGQWQITDLNSRMGTFVNGERVVEGQVIRPGDIIRVSTSIFRFDRLEKGVDEDDGALAIRGAVMDAELKAKGEAVVSLEGIRRRSSIDIDEEEQESARKSRLVAVNAALVGGVAVAVALCVFAVVSYGYHRVRTQQREQSRKLWQGRKRYSMAVGLVEGDSSRSPEAIRVLRTVLQDYQGTPVAAEAAAALSEIQWDYAESELKRISGLEAEGRYREAIAGYQNLSDLVSDPALSGLVEQRRGFAFRLARSALGQVEQQAERLLDQGNGAEAARSLYRQARERLGIPSLVAEIERKLSEIDSPRGSAP